jgi:branched-subunit amino acid transport protein
MAQTFSTELAGIDSVPSVKPSAINAYGARLKRFRASITLAAQASGDTIVLADLPAGYVFAYGVIVASVSLGATTVAIGDGSTTYRPAAVFTAVDTPTLFGSTTGVAQAASVATKRILATLAAAALPGAGTLVIDIYASMPN